jgi:outer membrane protein OmpA-like peptidoglycan-associated protein
MKRTLFFLIFILPIYSIAQNSSNFFDNVTIKVEKTQVNTSASDFGPAFVGNELWFSAFTAEEIDKINQGNTKNVFYNLYSVPLDMEGIITGGKKDRLAELSAGYHSGPVSYCESTGELFLTLSNYENPEIKNVVFQKANIPLKIVILKKSGGQWKETGELPFNNSSYSVGHPAISLTGDTLYFASNIPNKGMGGTDIYMTVRQNGSWSEMKNLGDEINTPGDEMFPFFDMKNTLIYASDGKSDSKGGLDIYYTTISGNDFEIPVNLEQINSSGDDFGMVIHSNGKTGYFTSNKEGGEGDDDIYKVLLEGKFELELLVRDKKTLSPVSSAKINFSDNMSRYTDNNGIITRDLDDDSDYTATSDVQGYMNESVSFTTKYKPFGIIKEVINIEKVEVGQKFVMENIYYDFDKWDIRPEAAEELDKLVKIMKDNPSWKVELSSHTDCRGNDSYNMKLSQKRAESAVDYIVSKGISRNKITAKGYGESQLVNHCDDGVECTEEQHQMNRRTEFEIIEM